jgi:glutamate-1-semialdehyde 2,1-aminomutase
MSAFDEVRAGDSRPIPHHGTWNANPLAAVAGIATLELVATGEPVRVAAQRAEALRGGLNELFAEMGVPAVAYGRGSIWKTMPGERPRILDGDYSNYVSEAERMSIGWGELDTPLRQAMLLRGVDPMRGAGFMSCVHESSDIDQTIEAFGRSIARLREDGHLAL